MNHYFLFYLYSIVDSLRFCLLSLAFVLAILLFLISTAWLSPINISEKAATSIKHFQKVTFFLIPTLFIIRSFIPNKNDMLLIVVGGSIAEYNSVNKLGETIPDDIIEWARAEINKQTSRANPEILDTNQVIKN